MSGKKQKLGLRPTLGTTSFQGLKIRRRPVTKPALALLAVVVVAVAAWMALSSRADKSWSPSSTAELFPPTATASDDTQIGDQATAAPKIVFPETSYDFGTIIQGANVSHTFVVRNAGDAPLTLLDVGGS